MSLNRAWKKRFKIMEKKHQTKPQAQKWKGVFHSWFRLGNIITKVKRKASFNHVPVLGSPVIRGKGGCRRSQASGQPRGAWPWSLNVGASLCIPLFCTKQALPFTDGHWGIKSILGYWCSRRPFFFFNALLEKGSVSAASAKVDSV